MFIHKEFVLHLAGQHTLGKLMENIPRKIRDLLFQAWGLKTVNMF